MTMNVYRRLTVVAVLVAAVLLWAGVAEAKDKYNGLTQIVTNSEYQMLAEDLHALPHISFWEYEKDVVINPDSKYIESICLMAVPFAIFGILLFSFGCCFGVLRCCGLCGGWKQTREYRTWERIVLRVFMVLTLLVVVVLCAGSLWGTVEMHHSIPDVSDKLNDFSGKIYKDLRKVVEDAAPLQAANFTFPAYLFTMYNDSKETHEDISDATEQLEHLELARDILTIIIISLVLIACLIGLVGGLLGWRLPSLYMAIFLWIALVLTWGCCAAHLSVSVLIADSCQTIDEYLIKEKFDKTEHYNQTAVMEYYLFCNVSMPNDIAQLAGQAVLLNQYSGAQYQAAVAAKNESQIKHWGTIYNQSEVLLTDTMVSIQCNQTAQFYNETKEELCTDVILGTFMVMITQFFVGIIGIVVVMLGILAYKRFGVPVDYILQGNSGRYDYDATASARERRRLQRREDSSINRLLQ